MYIYFIIFNLLYINTTENKDVTNQSIGALLQENLNDIRKKFNDQNIPTNDLDILEENIKLLLMSYNSNSDKISLNNLNIYIIIAIIMSLWTYIFVNIKFFIKYFNTDTTINKENKQKTSKNIKTIIY
ncbi:hypothetical protein AB836_01330 [Rickettsiales bacterium (ex Bugula neritina AB1)]|nr:hypothetical protein AB836_01330 [Rickettsiales bacterium (ex Bugula neritina AB1)]